MYVIRDNPTLVQHIDDKVSSSQAKPTTASIKKVSEYLPLNDRLEKTNASVCICMLYEFRWHSPQQRGQRVLPGHDPEKKPLKTPGKSLQLV